MVYSITKHDIVPKHILLSPEEQTFVDNLGWDSPQGVFESIIGDETFGGWWVGYQSTGDLGCDFTFNPIKQAVANPYRFEAVVSNDGALDQTNTTMHVEVDNFGNLTLKSEQ